MLSSIAVLAVGAALTAAAAFWALRAYRRAGGGDRSAQPAMIACGAVALLALGVYLVIGRPELPDAPFAERLAALKHRDPTTYTADEALAVLAEGARDHPADAAPHLYSGQLLMAQGRAREAAAAFDAALRRDPRSGEALLGLGRAMVASEDGRVTPEALAVFQQAGELSADPAPWMYQAMAALQAGRDDDARRFWREALARMGPDDERRAMVQQQVGANP